MKKLMIRLFGKRGTVEEHEQDVLKALYHLPEDTIEGQVEEISLRSNIGKENVFPIIERLREKGYCDNDKLKLTIKGERKALKLIRSHRLYEQFLAEYSGYDASEWHKVAHKKEHHLSKKEEEKLVKLLGNPVYDPHGDPIPTLGKLNLPQKKYTPILSINVGDYFEIVHIEDDEEELYNRLVSEGIAKGSVIQIKGIYTRTFTYFYEGRERVLPLACLNVLDLKYVEENEINKEELFARRLTNLKEGEEAMIVGISSSCRGAMRRRLMDLGFVKGSTVSIEMASPLNNPIAYVVRATAIALRRDQARYVLITKL